MHKSSNTSIYKHICETSTRHYNLGLDGNCVCRYAPDSDWIYIINSEWRSNNQDVVEARTDAKSVLSCFSLNVVHGRLEGTKARKLGGERQLRVVQCAFFEGLHANNADDAGHDAGRKIPQGLRQGVKWNSAMLGWHLHRDLFLALCVHAQTGASAAWNI